MTHRNEPATVSVMRPVAERTGIEQSHTRCCRQSESQYPTSSEAAHRIKSRVMARLAGRPLSLRILVRPDGLVLEGRVRSYYAKQLVQEAVRKFSDTPIAENAVEVV